MVYELKHIPQDVEERQQQGERLRQQGLKFAGEALNLEPRHLAFIETSGMLEASQDFARRSSWPSTFASSDGWQVKMCARPTPTKLPSTTWWR